MIYVSQTNITPELSKELIEFFNSNILKTYVWDETRVLSMDAGGMGNKELPDVYHKLVELTKTIKSFVDHDPKFSILQNVEIVKYPCGAAKGYHYDVTRKTTTGASITYLNDDYLGGNTIIGGVDVQPMMGRTVYFDGCEFRHAVSNVLKGDRYTISSWYGEDVSLPLNKDFTNL